MSLENFVVVILCSMATLDDLMYERERHHAIAVDILQYDPSVDYLRLRQVRSQEDAIQVNLMFVFRRDDSVIIRTNQDQQLVEERLAKGDCGRAA